MNDKTIHQIPKELLKLLPWFAINKLDTEDQTAFENAFESYPLLHALVLDEQKIIKKISSDKSLLAKRIIAPPEERLKIVFNMIDQSQSGAQLNGTSNESCSILVIIKDKFSSLISSLQNIPQVVQVAGIGALVLSIATLSAVSVTSKTENSDFQLASAKTEPATNQTPPTNAVNTTLLVGFNGTSEDLRKISALKGKQMKIKSPPNKEGFFQISFNKSMNADEIKTTIEALLSHEDSIWFAGEAF